LKYLSIVILALIIGGCVTPNTKTTKFDPAEVQAMPEEIAIEALTTFSKTADSDPRSNCVFTDSGVKNKNSNMVFPYTRLYFNAKMKSYNAIEADDPHIYIFNKDDENCICNSKISHGDYAGAQKEFDLRFKWIGSALMSLGAEYKENLQD